MPLAAHTLLGPYEILGMLGTGGMGEVYRARDTRLVREVALKVLPERFSQDATALARFHREAKAVAALSHPGIVSIHDIGSEQGRTYVVMELLEGRTLGSYIKNSALDWRSALEIAIGTANGLAAAHAKGIVHRDIKPENIFLTGTSVKILDFGLARRDTQGIMSKRSRAKSATLSLETQPGVLMGTVSYMSPEQVRGQQADARSDVFAFGCVLYEMLTGSRPFKGETSADLMVSILHDAPPQLSESGARRPAELDRIVSRCLEKEPGKRFQSAKEILAALKKIPFKSTLDESAGPAHSETVVLPRPSSTQAEEGPSVAVLPFVNMSSDKENEYFSDGLAEELINVLSKIKGLHVASRTSAFAFKGKNEDVRQIGQQLNVKTVLEGSVRKSGNRLRITAQLVNAGDGYQLWSETYNRQLEDVFAIQDEIAQNIAKALQVILSEKVKRALEKARAVDVEAYDFYLRGMQCFHQFNRKSLEQAQQMFLRAIEIDPGYARAYAGLADCYSLLYKNWNAPRENLELADKASKKALELDPELAEAHIARGVALSYNGHSDESEKEFETAVKLNPKLFEAYYFYARACVTLGKLVEAARLFDQASQVGPEDYQAPLLGAAVLAGLGRHDEAQQAYRRGVQAAEKHLELHSDDARALVLGATGWCQLGEPKRALDWVRRALAVDPDEAMTLYNVACAYALMGRTDEAIDCLEKAVDNGYTHKEWIENDADFKSLHGQPRFQALLQSLTDSPPERGKVKAKKKKGTGKKKTDRKR